jgi:hypothetical protein
MPACIIRRQFVRSSAKENMHRSAKRMAIMLALTGLLAGAALYLLASADPPGYCRASGRFLSDADFIGIAIRNAIREGYVDIGESETSIQEFRATHARCCLVDRTPASPLDRMLGINAVGVYMSYLPSNKPSQQQTSEEGYYVVRARIHACGNVEEISGGRVIKQTVPIIKN